MYNEIKPILNEGDECLTKGICSVNTTQSAINEIILLYLKELSFYIVRLKNLGITNAQVKEVFLDNIFNIVANVTFNQECFHKIISNLYDYIQQSKFLYEKVCTERGLLIEKNKSYFKYTKKFDLTDAIRKGEKYYIKKIQNYSQEQSNMYDIILFVVKSMDLKLVELERFGQNDDECFYTMINLLDLMKPKDFSMEKIRQEISNAIVSYYNLAKKLRDTLVENYGSFKMTEVSFSSHEGKAVLVSGSDYKKLEDVLIAAKDKGINVYTHGSEMLMAHSLPKIKAFPNLKGHFGVSHDGSLVDFASFPGSILITKGTLHSVEYLYRGRLFTLDPIPPVGVLRIKNNDYSPLIESALNSKGFSKPTVKPSHMVGFNINEIYAQAESVIKSYLKGDINHIYIVGLQHQPSNKSEYVEQLLNLIPEKSYVFSLAQKKVGENIYHLDSYYDYSLFFSIFKKFEEFLPISQINLSVFLTNCDKNTISNLIYMSSKGVKSLFMSKCPPSLMSPSLIKTLQGEFNISETTTPSADIQKTL